MASTSPFNDSTPSTLGDVSPIAGPNNDQYKVVRKRNRVPLSCAPCRSRKLKCNRSSPCENCVKRGAAASCSYAAPGARKKTVSRSQPSGTTDDMQNRIDKLEGLVLSLMSTGNEPMTRATANSAMSQSTGSNPHTPYTPQGSDDTQREDSVESETDRIAKSLGVLHFNNNQTSYIGDSHWATILHEISEVKNYFKEHQKQYEEALNTVEANRREAGIQATGPAFLLAGRSPPDFKELINRLPRRTEVDQLVQRYFDDFDPALRILHIPTWRKQYNTYWQNPANSNAAFLGQLYSLCGLAMQSYYKNQDEPYEYQGRSQDLSIMYRGLTQQCLHLVDYSKIEQTTIETLILHFHAEYQKTGEGDVSLWVLSRMVISLAMRTGIHRDGKNFPSITPFQCEMRRRIWTFLRTMDTFLSFAVGLPSLIRESDTDTELPTNINDDDFNEDTEVMPPSRSRNEFTEVSYLIAKAELTIAFSRITSAISGTGTISYEQVSNLNEEIRDVYNGIFPLLHVRNADDFQTGSNDIFMMRMNVSTQYNKSLCVLHRRYLGLARGNPRYVPSRQACIDASIALLRNQQIIEKESRPGGRMYKSSSNVNSLIITPLMAHDFILAGTLIALDLLGSVQAEAAGRTSGDLEVWGRDRKVEQLEAIQGARDIWDSLRGRYVEAYKASSICGVMIQKIQQFSRLIPTSQTRQNAVPYTPVAEVSLSEARDPSNMGRPEHSAALSLGMLSNGTLPSEWKPDNLSSNQGNAQNMIDAQNSTMMPAFPMDTPAAGGNAFPFFSGLGGETPANMDWNAWDEYMQNPTLDTSLNGETWSQNYDFTASNFDTIQAANGDPPGSSQQLDGGVFASPNSLIHQGTNI